MITHILQKNNVLDFFGNSYMLKKIFLLQMMHILITNTIKKYHLGLMSILFYQMGKFKMLFLKAI